MVPGVPGGIVGRRRQAAVGETTVSAASAAAAVAQRISGTTSQTPSAANCVEAQISQ